MSKPMKFPQEALALSLRSAMDDAKLSQADLARACGVTIQSVHGWRKNGRIGKQHLLTICNSRESRSNISSHPQSQEWI